jgi:hypothetical protein
MTHDLKTWPEFFRAVQQKKKEFEVRKNDRDFKVGDVLHLREWSPEMLDYTGFSTTRTVTYILRGGQFGIAPDYVVMGLRR